MKPLRTLFILLLCAFFLQYCDSLKGPDACTEEFVIHEITVLDTTGQPADSVDITVSNLDADEPYEICNDSYCDEDSLSNPYTIMHDGLMDEISRDKEEVLVTGSREELSFEEEYEFRNNSCHVEKLAGPDTVSLDS